MEQRELEIWWSSLPISEKERIARKGLMKESKDGAIDESMAFYPGCTVWWNKLEHDRQVKVYKHCVAVHGDEVKEWNEGHPYGD